MATSKESKITETEKSSIEAIAQRVDREPQGTVHGLSGPGSLENLPESVAINPGMADIQLVQVTQLGHRDKFPRPYDWENLIPMLHPNEELLSM